MAKVNIGNRIKSVVLQKGMPLSEFARRINLSRTSIYHIFERDSIDTELLSRISRALEHDFFSYYKVERSDYVSEPANSYSPGIKEELEQLKAQIQLLLKVVSLLEKKAGKTKKGS